MLFVGQHVWYGDKDERVEAVIVSFQRKRVGIRLQDGVTMAVRLYRLEAMGGPEVVGQASLLGEEFVPMAGDCEANVRVVFDAWKTASGRARTMLDGKRKAKIAAALRIYPLDDVLDAVRGWKNDSFYTGDNDRHAIYNEITMLLRDAEHIERFRDLARGPVRERQRGGQERRDAAFDVRRRVALGEL